jgi:hypothetical protein
MIGLTLQAQSIYSYQYLTELDSISSEGYTIIPDSENGYYLLYSSMNDTNSYLYQPSIAHFDSTNTLLWSQDYFISPNGNISYDMIETCDSHFVFCGYVLDPFAKGCFGKVKMQNGDEVYSKTYSYSRSMLFERVVETSDSNYLVIGITDSLTSGSLSRWDIYVAKMDTAGNILWDKLILTDSYSTFDLFATRINDKIYISTYSYFDYYSSYQLTEGRLFCINENGSVTLDKYIDAGVYGEKPHKIIESNDGNLIIGGIAADFRYPMDGSLYQGIGYGYVFIRKIDTLGNTIWSEKYFIPSLMQSGYSIYNVSDGYVISGATGWGIFYGADSLYNSPSTSITDVYIMRIKENGDSVWMRMYRNMDGSQESNTNWTLQDIPFSMCQFNDGSIGLTGKMFPLTSINPMPPHSAWILRTDSNGCGKPGTPYGLWREELPYNQDSSIVHLTWLDDDATNIWHHVQGSKDGQYYFWELTPRPVTNKEFFDTVPKYHTYCYRVFGLDSTWARTCESAEICITTGIEEYGTETGLLSVYPNPATNIINCVLPDNEDYEIIIYNALSSNVTSSGVEKAFVNGICTINISYLPPGIYFIEARGKKTLRGRFVKE